MGITRIKSYTDLEQSKKLVEFLPPESADMYWMHGKLDNVKQRPTPNIIGNDCDEPLWDDYDLPCWSLAALLNVLSNYQLQTQDDGIGILCSCNGNFNIVTADNQVNAAFKMIICLNKLNLL